jgi:hypothetical protein
MRNRCELLAAVFLLLRRDSLVKAIADVPLRLQAKVNMDYFSNLAKKTFYTGYINGTGKQQTLET